MKSWCASWPTDDPRPSARWADAAGRRFLPLLLLALLLPRARPAGAEVSPSAWPSASPTETLDEARRLLREGTVDPAQLRHAADAGGLFRVRAKLLAAAIALARGEREGVDANLAGLPAAPLGIAALPAFLHAAARASLAELTAAAAAAGDTPVGRAALLSATRLARSDVERAALRAALAGLPADPGKPRATIARAVGLARVAPSREEARRLLVALAVALPDAVTRAPDLFEPEDAEAFRTAARAAPDAARLARARAIVGRDADEALALAGSLPKSPENRLALAELALAAGRAREARKAIERPSPLAFADPPRALHLRVVHLLARVRDETRLAPRRRPKRPLPIRGNAPPRPAGLRVPDRDEDELARLLASPLADADRKPLLLVGLKIALGDGRRDDARRLVDEVLALDPASSAGAEDLFVDAFTAYRRGVAERSRPGLLAAAKLFEEQVARYREVTVRRRATYWAAKARAAAGELDQARALWAGLVSGTSADLYGRWAAAAIGVPLPAPPPETEVAGGGLPLEAPAPASRELLACGLPGLAEDAAEAEGSLDPDFAAILASERGDHRRAAALLKARYPQLGTPEEGAVPIAARRAFYPLGASRVLIGAAQEQRIPPALLFGLVRQESLFQPSVRSHAGAVGLLQVMPATGRFLQRLAGEKGRPNLNDPATNARLGAAYLARLLGTFDGDAAAALAAYNAGPGRVARWRREAAGLSSDEFLESIPLSEPRDYVRRVLFYEGAYTALYGIPAGPITRPAAVAPEPRL